MTHPAEDVIVIGKMGLAVVTTVDFVTVEVSVVSQTHGGVSVQWRDASQGRCK